MLVGYSAGMACGQVLFKLAAKQVEQGTSPIAYLNTAMVSGLALYLVLSVLWVWLLRFIPLSRAYPFAALAFVFTPLLAKLVLGETLSSGYLVGTVLIMAGILIILAN
jgi:drug/metabolite transporter (DMT)-like permease